MNSGDNSKNSVDVLISGAGPTGLMLANYLAKEKVSFRIIDVNAERAKESRALAIQARSLELLHNLGLVQKFLERGMRAQGLCIFVNGEQAVQLNFSDIGRGDTPYPYIFFLSQSVTEEILEESLEAQGLKVDRSTLLGKFTQNSNGVTAQLARFDGTTETVTARYLVGCDGARSQVRKTLGLEFVGGTYDAEFLLADAKVHWNLPSDRLLLMLGEKNISMVMPMKGSSLSRVVTISENKEGTEAAKTNLTTKLPATLEGVEACLQAAATRPVKLSAPEWITRYRVHHRSVERMRVDRVFLAGDAAHIHSPAGGQGMNTGLQDAANLAWKLTHVIKHGTSPELLETYHTERWPIAQKLLKFTDRFFSAASSASPLTKKIRNFVLPFAGKFLKVRSVRLYMFGFVSQLNIRYHESVAVRSDLRGLKREKKVHAGQRAPDAKLKSGKMIFELLQGYEFNVLVMSRRHLEESARLRFESFWKSSLKIDSKIDNGQARIHWIEGDSEAEALDAYQVDDVLVSLVRPDGYIGYQCDYIETPL